MMAVVAKVRVLKMGLYLKPNLRSQTASNGDEILVLGGNYAASLEEDGLAEILPMVGEQGTATVGAQGKEVKEEGKLEDVNGIGAATAKKLVAAGIGSLVQLVDADTAVVAETAGVGIDKAADWQAQAAKLIDGG